MTKEKADPKPNRASFSVGSLITSYNPGIHKVLSIGRYRENASNYLITYEQVLDSKFMKPRGKKVQACDSAWCKPVDRSFLEKVKASHRSQIENLELALALAYPNSGMNGTDND